MVNLVLLTDSFRVKYFAIFVYGQDFKNFMKSTLLQRNIVVNGQFNLNLLDKYFFIKNGIISEEEFAGMQNPPVFNGFNSHIATTKYEITINPIQLVIYDAHPGKNDVKINEILIQIIKASGVSKFQSLGINFDWTLEFNSGEELQRKAKEYFYNEKAIMMSSIFNTSDTHYGFYVSKDVLGGRLKLDVKPINSITYPLKGTFPINALHNKFNFHFALNSSDIMPFLSNFKVYEQEAEKIMASYK
jgi:hypothetical protein